MPLGRLEVSKRAWLNTRCKTNFWPRAADRDQASHTGSRGQDSYKQCLTRLWFPSLAPVHAACVGRHAHVSIRGVPHTLLRLGRLDFLYRRVGDLTSCTGSSVFWFLLGLERSSSQMCSHQTFARSRDAQNLSRFTHHKDFD